MIHALVLSAAVILSVQGAIEPDYLQRKDPVKKDEPVKPAQAPAGFSLPSFGGVKVSYQPKADGNKAKADAHPQAGEGDSKPVKKPEAEKKEQEKKPIEQAPKDTKEDKDQKKKKEEEQQQQLKEDKKEQDALRKKKEQETKKEQEALKKKQEQEASNARKKKEQESNDQKDEKEKKKQPEPKKANPSATPKQKRNPIPTKYEVPSNAGIGGVGGGKLPDPGFILEPGDLFQKAENGGVCMVKPSVLLSVLLSFSVVFIGLL